MQESNSAKARRPRPFRCRPSNGSADLHRSEPHREESKPQLRHRRSAQESIRPPNHRESCPTARRWKTDSIQSSVDSLSQPIPEYWMMPSSAQCQPQSRGKEPPQRQHPARSSSRISVQMIRASLIHRHTRPVVQPHAAPELRSTYPLAGYEPGARCSSAPPS
jgi:hypothetical protein